MTPAVAIKLLAVLLTAALGYAAGRSRLLTHGAAGSDAARVLSNTALYVFVPALPFPAPPVGTNALQFTQHHGVLEAEATAFWLAVLSLT